MENREELAALIAAIYGAGSIMGFYSNPNRLGWENPLTIAIDAKKFAETILGPENNEDQKS